MTSERNKIFRLAYFLYSLLVVGITLFIVYARYPSPNPLTWLEEFFTVPGVILGILVCPDCAHGGGSLGPLIMSVLIMLPYLTTPILAVVIIRWWKRINRPWTPKD